MSETVLVRIGLQNDYFEGGAYPVTNTLAAAVQAAVMSALAFAYVEVISTDDGPQR